MLARSGQCRAHRVAGVRREESQNAGLETRLCRGVVDHQSEDGQEPEDQGNMLMKVLKARPAAYLPAWLSEYAFANRTG